MPPLVDTLCRWPEEHAGGPLTVILFVPNTERLIFYWSRFEPLAVVEGGTIRPVAPNAVNHA